MPRSPFWRSSGERRFQATAVSATISSQPNWSEYHCGKAARAWTCSMTGSLKGRGREYARKFFGENTGITMGAKYAALASNTTTIEGLIHAQRGRPGADSI